MSRMSQVLASMVLTAVFLSPLSAQTERIKARFMGTQQTKERPTAPGAGQPGVVANPTSPAILFDPAAVGVSSSAAQTLDATFDVSGYSGSFTPTASSHYGHDYKLGTVTCAGGSGSETCTVPVTFIPTLPGARKDALLLMDGSTVLATVLLGGTGQSGMSLIQPGVVTSPLSGEPFYIYQSVVDENGTVYFLVDNGGAMYSYTKAGVLTELPLTDVSPHAIDIDGAGNLYIAQNAYGEDIVTYSPAGVQGSIKVYPPPPYVFCSNSNGGSLEYLYSVAVDQSGNLFTLEILCNEIFELTPEGTYVTTAIDPSMIQPSEISVDANDNVYIGGYDINVLTAAGIQTQVNTVGATEGIAADPAGTIYATRYTGVGGVAELPASNYTTSIANLDPAASPLGEGLGSDGTLYVGNYGNLDKVDRSQGAIAFGEQNVGVKSSAQDVSVYNGGNESLTVSNIAITGTSFALSVASSDPCKKGSVLAPGSFCQVAVTMNAPHAGTFSGTVTFTSNTLNTTATKQTVTLSGYVYGPYVTASPSSVAFPPQLVGTTSATKSVTLTNNGDLYAAFIGTPSSSNSAFTVGIGTCTSELAVGSSCALSVTFNPAAPQSYSGTVTVPISSSGGGSWPALTFNVSGSGTWMELTPKTTNFGNETVGTTSAPKKIELINEGTTTVNITSIAITGADAGDFAETNSCGSGLAGGKDCVIKVTFTPSTTGKRTAQVSVSDNSGGSPQTATLEGNGTP
jgi:hypothetical protein